MLVGWPPFEAEDPLALYKTIVANEPRYPKKLSSNSVDLIRALLTSDPTERLGSAKGGADDVKNHPFFRKIIAWCAAKPIVCE